MKFVVVTNVDHAEKDGYYYAYAPYVQELNLWFRHVDQPIVIGHSEIRETTPIEIHYEVEHLQFRKVPEFSLTSFSNILSAFVRIPYNTFQLFKVFKKADHIHLRCPSNMGLLGCIVQVFFPSKKKTVKYAGNWDPKSKQPIFYRLQKWIVSNTMLTKNCQVLVYGEWPNQSRNIKPFFTASYSVKELEGKVLTKNKDAITAMFVGSFSEGKRPLYAVKIVEKLRNDGINLVLEMFGDGPLFSEVKNYVNTHGLDHCIILHGNRSKNEVKKAYQRSHFLFLLSQSEGWPKVVAEAMFWRCIPISTPVSCVPYMLGNGQRGVLFDKDENTMIVNLKSLIENKDTMTQMAEDAKTWSRKFTLEYFNEAIQKLI